MTHHPPPPTRNDTPPNNHPAAPPSGRPASRTPAACESAVPFWHLLHRLHLLHRVHLLAAEARAVLTLCLLTTSAAGALTALVAGLQRRLRILHRRPEAGYANETIVVTAILVAAAVLVVGIIVDKVKARANSIDLGP